MAMRGRIYQWTDEEQALREWTTAQRKAYQAYQQIERQRWERDVLAPAQSRVLAMIRAGAKLPELEISTDPQLPEGA